MNISAKTKINPVTPKIVVKLNEIAHWEIDEKEEREVASSIKTKIANQIKHIKINKYSRAGSFPTVYFTRGFMIMEALS
jgi:hypothetical protein